MELNHLKYFYHVAREGGFSKASRSIKIAQPAITKMVKNLESELGVQLFERIGKTVRLTKIGNDIFRKCELIFDHVNDIKRMSGGEGSEVSGNLTLGAVEPIATHLIPPVIGRLLQTYPKIYPQIVTATASDLCRLVSSRKLDLALLFHAPILSDDLEVRTTFPVKFKLVVATAKKKDSVVCSSFIGSREVDDVGNQKYPTLTKLRKRYPNAEIKISSNTLSSHLKMVLDGLGVSILPEYLIKADLKAKRLSVLLDDEDFTFKLKLVLRRSDPIPIGAKLFIEQFSKELSSLL